VRPQHRSVPECLSFSDVCANASLLTELSCLFSELIRRSDSRLAHCQCQATSLLEGWIEFQVVRSAPQGFVEVTRWTRFSEGTPYGGLRRGNPCGFQGLCSGVTWSSSGRGVKRGVDSFRDREERYRSGELVQLPLSVDALQMVLAAVQEAKPRPSHEILHGAGDPDFTRRGGGIEVVGRSGCGL